MLRVEELIADVLAKMGFFATFRRKFGGNFLPQNPGVLGAPLRVAAKMQTLITCKLQPLIDTRPQTLLIMVVGLRYVSAEDYLAQGDVSKVSRRQSDWALDVGVVPLVKFPCRVLDLNLLKPSSLPRDEASVIHIARKQNGRLAYQGRRILDPNTLWHRRFWRGLSSTRYPFLQPLIFI